LAFRARLALHFVLRPRVSGAHVVVRVGDRVLMVRNSYRRGLGLPAGRVGRKETPAEAACRELREEVGIQCSVGDLEAVGSTVLRHEFMTDQLHVFQLILDAAPPVRPDRREVTWAGFMTLDDVASADLQAPARTWFEGIHHAGS